jgi:hypothetical protein
MKRYIGVLAAAVAILIGGTQIVKTIKAKSEQADRDRSMSEIQKNYLERVGWIRSNPDEKMYKDEVGTFFRWYFKEINEHHNQFHGNRNFDGYLQELKEKKDPQATEKKARFEYVKAYLDQFKSGNYTPLWSSTDKGMRLDIAKAGVVNEGGKERIRVALVLWGAQREMANDGGAKRPMARASFNITWKLFDEKGKLHAEQNISGDPSMKIEWPERYIPEFPAQMVLGHFDLDFLPSEAAKSEMQIAVNSHASSGGDINATYNWKLDVPAEWKIKAGQKWEGAQESVRPEDEIDPSKAPPQAQR